LNGGSSSGAKSVEALLKNSSDIADKVEQAEGRYQAAGDALVTYSYALDTAQSTTAAALAAAKPAAAQAASQRQQEKTNTQSATGSTDPDEAATYTRLATTAHNSAVEAESVVTTQKGIVDQAVSDRNVAAQAAIDRIKDVIKNDGLNDGFWENWGSKIVTWISKIAEVISQIAGILALVLCWVPVLGEALAAVAAIAGIVAALANLVLAAKGEMSWGEAGLSCVFAALGCVGLGGAKGALSALKGGSGLLRGGLKTAFKEGLGNLKSLGRAGLSGVKNLKSTGQNALNRLRNTPDLFRSAGQRIKCLVKAEPVNVGSGEVWVQQTDFQVPGRIPFAWIRDYGSASTHVGVLGRGWETPADIRLEVRHATGLVHMRRPVEGPLFFDGLPEEGVDGVLELTTGAVLTDEGDEFCVRTKELLTYHFAKNLVHDTDQEATIFPVERISDLSGNWWDFERQDGTLVAINESAGRRIGLDMADGYLREVSLTVPGTSTKHVFVTYVFDDAGDLVTALDALNNPAKYAYDNHHMVCITDRNDLSFYYAFDKSTPTWRVTHSWGDHGLYDYKFAYSDQERHITDSLGHLTVLTLNDTGLPEREMDPLGGVTLYEYDDAGRTRATVDPSGRRTEFTFDHFGNLIKQINPDGATVATEFNDVYKPIRITTPDGAVWQQSWSERGLLSTQVTPLGHVRRFDYDQSGLPTSYNNTRGATTLIEYDTFGNATRVVDPLGHPTEYTHDGLGQVLTKRDALGQETDYGYDAKGRLTTVSLPSGSAIACSFDDEDNLIAYTDENGHTTRLEYFGQGLLARRIEADGTTVAYEHDTEERLTRVINQRGQHYNLNRDPLGRIIEEVDYWGQSRHYAFDPAGFLTLSIDPLGNTITFDRDAAGRVTRKHLHTQADASDEIETFTYTISGALLAATNHHVILTRDYDLEGRLLQEVQARRTGEHYTIANTFDPQGNRTRRTTRSNAGSHHTIDYDYDPCDHVTAITLDQTTPIHIHRDALGRILDQTINHEVNNHFDYDLDGRLTGQTISHSDDHLFDIGYTYDPVGNMTRRTDSHYGVETFRYDPIGQVLQHTDPHQVVHRFLHDPAGDLMSTVATSDGSTVTESEATPWQREGTFDGTTYIYDRAGNLTRTHDSNHLLEYTWDAHQHLTTSRITHPDGTPTTTSYGYDPLGRRVFKHTGDTHTWFGWDGDTLTLDVITNQPREYVYWPGTFQPLAVLTDQPLLYVNDPNGAPTRLIDTHGTTHWAATSTTTGQAQEHVPNVPNPIRLQGQYHDHETGLHYNRNRYYHPALASFISQDPIGLTGGTNPYQYAPNTTGWIDPLGLAPHRPQEPVQGGPQPPKNGTPRTNTAQNKQFRGAVQVAGRELGITLTKDQMKELHRVISGENYSFDEIVDEAKSLFGKSEE